MDASGVSSYLSSGAGPRIGTDGAGKGPSTLCPRDPGACTAERYRLEARTVSSNKSFVEIDLFGEIGMPPAKNKNGLDLSI